MGWLDFLERRSNKQKETVLDESMVSFISLIEGIENDNRQITREEATNIPALAASIEYIANTVAILPIYLYEGDSNTVKQIEDDRTLLLNNDTHDTLDGFQFKKALVKDFLYGGAGYAYIHRDRSKVLSLHYIPEPDVFTRKNNDIVFKDYQIMVQGKTYEPWEFIKITRNTEDGVTGKGILKEHNRILLLAYSYLAYEKMLISTNGNKKGFLKSQKKLTQTALDELERKWNDIYKRNVPARVLNDGIDFKEISSTSVEMQLNENKKHNDNVIYNLLNVPKSLLDGSSNINDVTYNNFMKSTILPILTAFQTALNKDLLLESEQRNRYFAFDTRAITKADIEKRYKAYQIAINSGIMDVDEARFMENMEPLGIDFTKLGLQDVLFYPETGEIYTPNTGMFANLKTGKVRKIGETSIDGGAEGGEGIEIGNKE